MGAASYLRRPTARRLVGAASWLTTPLLPDDYLRFINPLWSSRELRGRVIAVTPETLDSATLRLRPSRHWAGHEAGQYVGVAVEIDGIRHRRSYSLTSAPRAPDGCIAITVKAIAGGGVSEHLVRRTAPGTVVGLQAAAGAFALPEVLPQRLAFVAAGSGITPVMGMLRALAGSGAGERPDIVVLHVARTGEDAIFGAELRAMAAAGDLTLHEWHTAHRGRPSPSTLAELPGGWLERDTWACGPGALLDGLKALYDAAGVGDRLRVERFELPTVAAGAGGRIVFTRSGRTVDGDGRTPLLDAGERAGALLPSGCRMGICHTCVGRLRSGRVCDLRTGDVHGSPGDLIQTCVSAAAGPVEIDL